MWQSRWSSQGSADPCPASYRARSRREHRREQQGISSVISQVADLSRHIHSLQVSSTSLSRTSATSYGEIQPGGVNYHAASYSSSSTFTQSIHMSHSLRHQIAGELDKLPCEQATHRETKAALHAVIRSASPEAITCSAPLPPNSGTAVGVNAPAISFTQTTQAVSTGNHINPNLGFAEKVEAVFTLQCRVFGYQVSLGSVYGRRQRKVNVSKKFGQVKTSDSWHYVSRPSVAHWLLTPYPPGLTPFPGHRLTPPLPPHRGALQSPGRHVARLEVQREPDALHIQHKSRAQVLS